MISSHTLPRSRWLVAAALVCVAAWSRLVPHWPNFTAVPAMALFSGAVFGRRWAAYVLPLLAMLASDALLGLFVYGTRAFVMAPVVYAAIAATTWIGSVAKRRASNLLLAGLVANAFFFVSVNLYVWFVSDLYPPTSAGLLACYTAALPYAANMLLSTALYGAALLALWRFAESRTYSSEATTR